MSTGPVEARCIGSSGAAVISVSPIVSVKRSHGWRTWKVRS